MFDVSLWQDEILDTALTTASATGTGSATEFSISSAPLFIVKVTVAGSRVSNWYYNRATHKVVFDSAPASGAAILFYYLPEIQKGTDINAAHFNKIELDGVLDKELALGIIMNTIGQLHRETFIEEQTVTLANNLNFPFNSTMQTPVSVTLSNKRNSTDYEVEIEVTSRTGEVGEIYVTNKALNAFSLSFDGSGSSVTLKLRIKGGLA